MNNVKLINSEAYRNVEVRTAMEKVGQEINNAKISVDDFLKIMAAEISNQPVGGSDDGGGKTDYISQLAQLTTLEYMGDINSSLSFLKFQEEQQFGTSLLGQEVTVLENGRESTGIVDRVKFKNGLTILEIDGGEYYAGNVVEARAVDIEKSRPGMDKSYDDLELEDSSYVEREVSSINFEENSKKIDGKNIPDTKPLSRKEMTNEYFSNEFLKEKEFFDKNFKNLTK